MMMTRSPAPACVQISTFLSGCLQFALAVSVRPIYLCDCEIVAMQDEVARGRFCAPGELHHPHAEETRLSTDGVGFPARSLARHYSSTLSPDHFDRAEVGEDEFDDWH